MAIKLLRYLKKNTFLHHTWQWETIFVTAILLTIAILTGKKSVEFLGVAAVVFTFLHASVAERLEEAQRHYQKTMYPKDFLYTVKCYDKLTKYLYAKEICWCFYFFFIGAYSALGGVFIFLFYPIWRKYYRRNY